jgi:hypothetical protein
MSSLCGPLRISAFSASMVVSTQRSQRYAEGRSVNASDYLEDVFSLTSNA